MVKVHYDEGIAIHIGPEPCVGPREGIGEASAGDRAGQPLSRESFVIPDADAFPTAEGNTDGGASASPISGMRGREPQSPVVFHGGWVGVDRPRMCSRE